MDVNQIIRIYGKRIRDSNALRTLASKAKSYPDAQKFAAKATEILCEIIGKEVDIANIPPDDLMQIITGTLKTNHAEVTKVCAQVQRKLNEEIGIGMNAVEPEFDAERARGLSTTLSDAEEFSPEYLKNLLTNFSRSVVDRSIYENARAHKDAGLKTLIIRHYDGVGLHDGKESCKWCLDRQGEWDDYRSALSAGAFERHPGCGCYIEYHVGKTRTWSTSAGTWHDI